MRTLLVILLISAGGRGAAGEPACRTAGGVPCHTLRMATSRWSFFRNAWTDIRRSNSDFLTAVRADGSRATRESSGEFHLFDPDLPPEPPRRTILLKPAGRLIDLNEGRRRAFFLAFEAPETADNAACTAAAAGEASRYDQARPRVTGAGTRLGVHVVRWSMRTEDSWPSREEVAEFAPGLGCALMFKREVYRGSGWMPAEIVTSEAVSLVWGEPDPALFRVPAEYSLAGAVPSADPARAEAPKDLVRLMLGIPPAQLPALLPGTR